MGRPRSASLTSSVDGDPLTLALAPPPDETYRQRLVREVEAKKISDEIDEQIRQEQELHMNSRKTIKVLLLGQSGSGKSTALKRFRLTFARRKWLEDRASWRVVIYLNLVQHVNLILGLLAQETSDESVYTDGNTSNGSTEEVVAKSLLPFEFKEKHRLLRQRLKPLLKLQTRGIQEYRFVVDHGRAVGQEWRMYELECTRESRAAWYPYFDDANAIIFFAPLSHFDEKLAEDKRVNRLEDSFRLWRTVCASKLLARTHLILVLNKRDLLTAKLQRCIRIRDSVPSFGDRKNELPSATKYFRHFFREIAKQSSSTQRNLFIHLTSAIDTSFTFLALSAVENCILREHLRQQELV